jgi:DNA repair exonuclease SbcCD ATPase subunit
MSFPEQKQAYEQGASPTPGGEDSQAQPGNGGEVQQPDVGNIDKIREILFGGQMRDYEKRFSRVEERLTRESLDLREDTRKRFDVLEAYIKAEFAALTERLHAEQRTRDEADVGLWRGVQDMAQSLTAKLAEQQEQLERAQSDLREQILAQSKDLSDEIRQKQDEMTTLLQREVADLNHGKTDRSTLATLLTEMALRLNNDLKMPVIS